MLLLSRVGSSFPRQLTAASTRWLSTEEIKGCPMHGGAASKPETSAQAPPPPPLQPFESFPGLSFLGILKDAADPQKPFAQWKRFHERFGDFARFNLLGTKVLMSFNPSHWPEIIRAAGKMPGPLLITPWLMHEKQHKSRDPNYATNLVALEGEEWRKNRSVLDQVFSSIPRVQSYLPVVDQIGDDLVSLLASRLNPATGQVSSLYDHLYAFSNEVIGDIVFGQRLGSLSLGGRSELSEAFFQQLIELFSLMSELTMSIPWFEFFPTPKYRRFKKVLASIEQTCAQFVKNADAHHQAQQTDPATRFDLLQHMRQNGQSEERVLRNATTMFLAGSDSTTHTLMWLLYNLGRFPHVQEKLRAELDQHLPPGTPLTAETLHELKYLRATVKESMRLTPTASGLTRRFPHPIAVGGREVPAGTIIFLASFITNQKAEHFDQPDQLIPERWLETDRSKRPNSWLHIPFGNGPRVCQAFRLAELEAYVCMAKLVRNFRWTTENTVEPIMHLFLKPDRDVQIRWEQISASS